METSEVDLPSDCKRVFIAYAGEDYHFVEQLKDSLERQVATVWVDWENVKCFEGNLRDEPQCVARIREEVQNAALTIFIVSRSWVGKEFPMFELDWALQLKDHDSKILPVLLGWNLDQARAEVARHPKYSGLLETLLKLTVVNTHPPRQEEVLQRYPGVLFS